MVAACRFSEGATIIADSRVTWEVSNSSIYSDRAQKILYLSPQLAIAFAGTVALATSIVDEIRACINRKPSLNNPSKLSRKLSRIARFCYQKYLDDSGDHKISVCLLLGGVGVTGNIFLWTYELPDFIATIVHEWIVIGSGAVVSSYLKRNFKKIEAEKDTLAVKSHRLMMGLESELEKKELMNVGGLFQAILLTSKGICPLTYGFFDLRPEDPGIAKEITMSKGIWTQKDLTKKKEVELREPKIIVTCLAKEERFHDYKHHKFDKTELKWYLGHFITCLKTDRQMNKTIFKGVVSQIGSYSYPINMPIVVSLEFWGPRGIYPLRIFQDDCVDKKVVYEENIHIDYPYEPFELEKPLRLHIDGTGPIFLECYVQDHLLARKALFFGKPETNTPRTVKEMVNMRDLAIKNLVEEHRRCSDPVLKSRSSFLEFFIICQEGYLRDSEYEFLGELKAVYCKKYPLLLKLCIASGFRFSQGKHSARIDLVNAFTHQTTPVASGNFEGSSECIVSPVMGEVKIWIPESAIYYFNLYVDDQFLSSILLPAETDKPKFSYSLLDEHSKAVESGELLILAKRSKQAKNQ